MNKKILTIALVLNALVLVGAGCSKMTHDDKMMKNDSAPIDSGNMMDDEGMMKVSGQYLDYDASKLAMAAKGPVVLFFHASWCPDCKKTDTDITAHLKDIPTNFTILKVDYDSNSELKKQYGVTYQHTFVQVDTSGKMMKKWSGSSSLGDIVAHAK